VPKNNSAYIKCTARTKLLVISELVSFMCDSKLVSMYKNTGSHPNYILVSMQQQGRVMFEPPYSTNIYIQYSWHWQRGWDGGSFLPPLQKAVNSYIMSTLVPHRLPQAAV